MASGDTVVQILKVMPPATLAATIDYRPGASTPAEQFMVHDFNPSTVEYMDFLCKLEGYAGGGLTFTMFWSANATGVNAILSLAIRRIADDAEDVDISHAYSYQNVTDAAPTVEGEVVYTTLSLTDGAQMDNLAEGELFILRFRRRADQGGDTMNSDDLELWAVLGLES